MESKHLAPTPRMRGSPANKKKVMPGKQSTQISGQETCLQMTDAFSKLQRKPALAV